MDRSPSGPAPQQNLQYRARNEPDNQYMSGQSTCQVLGLFGQGLSKVIVWIRMYWIFQIFGIVPILSIL